MLNKFVVVVCCYCCILINVLRKCIDCEHCSSKSKTIAKNNERIKINRSITKQLTNEYFNATAPQQCKVTAQYFHCSEKGRKITEK